MRHKTKTAFVLAVGMWTVAAFVWPGCISAPLPNGHQPIAFRKQSDFVLPKSPQLTRSEVDSKLGKPDIYLPHLKIACYRVNEVTSRTLSLFLVIPVGVGRSPAGYDVALIQFDQQDRVIRSGLTLQPVDVFRQSKQENFETTAKQWLEEQEKAKH
jgi:hypothetical protein